MKGEPMKTKTLFLIASIFGVASLLNGCSCPNQQQYSQHRQHNKQAHPQVAETVVFYQTYNETDVDNVYAKMYTRSSRGGESPMGTIKFKETNGGVDMKVNLSDLRPGKLYKTHVFPCNACASGTCCASTPISADLPDIMIDTPGRLQTTYFVTGVNADQLNHGKLILTRDGGYKAAWGTIQQ